MAVMMVVPPTPIRTITVCMIFYALFIHTPSCTTTTTTTATKNNNNNNNSNVIKKKETTTTEKEMTWSKMLFLPTSMPLWGIMHVLAVHTSSIGSKRVHQASSIILLESSVYYALTQAIMLGLLHASGILSDVYLRVTATFCATYYYWFIITMAGIHPYSTLSHLCLHISMFFYCFGTAPYAMLGGIKDEDCESQTADKATTATFIAWNLADICAFVYKHAFLSSKIIRLKEFILD